MAAQAQVEDDFEVAKAVFEKLKDLAPDRQQRVLRWIAESLGTTPIGAPQVGIPSPGGTVIPPGSAGTSGTDIKTFVGTKNPKSDVQFAAVVAYYYRFEAPPTLRRESIDKDSLQEAARLAGRNRLQHPPTTLNNARKLGYLDGLTPGNFAINTVGENLVAMTLPAGGATPNAKKKKTNKKTAARRKK